MGKSAKTGKTEIFQAERQSTALPGRAHPGKHEDDGPRRSGTIPRSDPLGFRSTQETRCSRTKGHAHIVVVGVSFTGVNLTPGDFVASFAGRYPPPLPAGHKISWRTVR